LWKYTKREGEEKGTRTGESTEGQPGVKYSGGLLLDKQEKKKGGGAPDFGGLVLREITVGGLRYGAKWGQENGTT